MLFPLLTIAIVIDFLSFIFAGKRKYEPSLTRVLEFAGLVVLPFIYLSFLDDSTNDCCNDSATFSPGHKLTIHVLVGICIAVYYYSSLKSRIASPIIEVLVNSVLVFGFVFNVFVGIQVGDMFWYLGNLPVGMLIVIRLVENHKLFIELHKDESLQANTKFEKIAWGVLKLNPFVKVPLILVIFIPFLTVITSVLLIFGQKPDSIVRAFTDTYKHGFSQLDYMCDNVQCGGHFLCSVAANGHRSVVNPLRYGERNGNRIICNRQLLVANAFEEIIQEKFPRIHKLIRKNYNKVGTLIHRHYHIFNNKYISDAIYIMMKPLELLFLLTLYTFDCKPENRISKQYLNKMDRLALK